MSNFEEAHRIATVHYVFRHQEELLNFFFHHMKTELRLPVDELRKDAHASLNKIDRVLVNVALDLWTGENKTRLGDILNGLEYDELLGVMRGILHHCEIDPEYLDESLC